MVRTPGEIFSFMQSNKIGEKLSLFWIAWAFVAEKAENYKMTDQIFQKGIRRQAEPKDLIQKRYHQFQRRLARHYINLAENGELPDDSINNNNETEKPTRKALGTISKKQSTTNGSRVPIYDENNPQPQISFQSRSLSRSSRPLATGSGSISVPVNNGVQPFQIFSDCDTRSAQDEIVLPKVNNSWKSLGTQENRRKENDGTYT